MHSFPDSEQRNEDVVQARILNHSHSSCKLFHLCHCHLSDRVFVWYTMRRKFNSVSDLYIYPYLYHVENLTEFLFICYQFFSSFAGFFSKNLFFFSIDYCTSFPLAQKFRSTISPSRREFDFSADRRFVAHEETWVCQSNSSTYMMGCDGLPDRKLRKRKFRH